MADQAFLEGIIETNSKARADLMQAIDAIPAEKRLEPFLGEWSVKDIVAHMTGWQEGYAVGLEALARGERPVVPDFEDRDVDAYNARRAAESKDESWESVMARFRAAREHHEAAIRSLTGVDQDRLQEGRAGWTLANYAEHDHEHAPQIEAWRREQGL